MKAIIIEDELLVARDLQKLIRELDPEIEVLTVLPSVKTAVDYFKTNPEPDLLFMDIQLSDGVSFDIFKQTGIKCPAIFTTAYDEYAVRAFKVNSIDYLLKPIDKNDLATAIDKFKKQQSSALPEMKGQLESLLHHISGAGPAKIYKERFIAHSGKTFVVIDQSNIAYFHKDILIYIVTNDKKQFTTDFQSMEEIDELLDPKFFFRANRQFIISAPAVDSFRGDSYGKLIVKLKAPLDAAVDVSREKAQAFKTWLF